MSEATSSEDSREPHRSPTYAGFVQQTRRVLGLSEKPPPTECLNPGLRRLMEKALGYQQQTEDSPPPAERLNPSLHDLMEEAFARAEKYRAAQAMTPKDDLTS